MSDTDVLKQCRLTPETEGAVRRVDSTVRQRRRQRFVKFPELWIERLANAHHIATYRVALWLLHKQWQYKGRPFPVPNTIGGVKRDAKSDALFELEKLGLISLERRGRKSPLVTVMMLGD
jgi:hypothetical protein